MAFRFEDLEVWKRAISLSNEIETIAKEFPKIELFSFVSQIKRAADSVVLNIAEGSTGQSKPEFRRFLNYLLRSGIEVVSCLLPQKADHTFLPRIKITALRNSL